MFTYGVIDGIRVRDLKKYVDERGWLTEIFREDEIETQYMPVMGYISMTGRGTARGPHEHADQTDHFCFLGPSTFKVYLWDNRRHSQTFMTRQVVVTGEDAPKSIIIPPGIVHAYRNIGDTMGMVVNCPNRLYAGRGKNDPVDELRHEDDPNTIFKLD